MATITKRKNPSGKTVYRVQIRINKHDYPTFTQSRTFSTHALAVAWAKKREAEIEANPDILLGIEKRHTIYPTLSEAIERYLLETQTAFGRSKKMGLSFLRDFPIGQVRLDRLRRSDFTTHAQLRRNGQPEKEIMPVAPSTALQDLQYIRSVLKWAYKSWDMEKVNWLELDIACEILRDNRIVAKSNQRDRLPTSQELQDLTTFFYQQWTASRHLNKIPMHLIIWLAIYSCRRQDELCRLRYDDLNIELKEWLIRDVKNPNGSKGNHLKSWVNDEMIAISNLILEDKIQTRLSDVKHDKLALLGLNSKSISAAFTRACKTLGIDDLCFHDLRHEGATRLAENGLTPPQIQKYTLHTNWKTLERYVNLRRRPECLDYQTALKVAGCLK
ncbi:tyrosine-type recombinase/integrase [Wielerella bovis]|uniref:tyrosine-type recombinase/integrase n=1 Tax=Wielerella bovis TaxID=2917790 RepID=UPI0020189AF7|nr:tyrosine-type recombinase/integrase [Wielerella bovis]ULJ66621.1 tyrosine-type recombinase/integrase [Wielerella bovis]